ncbi:anti-sigma factor family protein [Streptomyces sp. NPDC058067]|uniref:anti-sigma factor family protein n=1 Tax=Streptomyces sp. NPDC058067 TaxID=3346324 RepID=UPI0036EDBB5B
MTSTTDTAEHPEVSEISALTEGLLSPSRTADVRQHLDGCELCADVYASLEEIRGMLGTLPGPPHMPADIAGRIDAALAAEALLDTSASVPAEDAAEPEAAERPGAVIDEPQSVSAVSRETSSADSPSTSADRPSGRPRAATGPGRGGRTRTRRRRGAALGAVFTAAAIGLGVLLLQNGGGTPTGAPESGVPRRASSALSFSEKTLEGQVQGLLTENSSAPTDSSTSNPSVDIQQTAPKTPRSNSPMRGKAITVPDCIQRGTGRETPALAVERGDYKGTTAYLVVLPHESDPSQVSAYVIDAACVKQASSAPGKLLLTHSYARR